MNSRYQVGRVYIFKGMNKIRGSEKRTVILTGENRNDHFGSSISSVGDLNIDGYNDLAVGAIWYDDNSQSLELTNAGRVYIFFGRENLSDMSANDADIIITGEQKDSFFGCSIEFGDFIEDGGYPDILIGACGFDVSDKNNLYQDSGRVYVLSGYDLIHLLEANGEKYFAVNDILNLNDCYSFVLEGKYNGFYHSGDYFGSEVANGGNFFNINKNSRDAILVGAPHFDNPNQSPYQLDVGILFAYNMNQTGIDLEKPDFIFFNKEAQYDNPHCFDASWVGKINNNQKSNILTMSNNDLFILSSNKNSNFFNSEE